MRSDLFLKKADKKAIQRLIDLIIQKYSFSNEKAKEYLLYHMNSVARAQNGESDGWNEEGAIPFFDWAIKTIIKKRNNNIKFNKSSKFLIQIIVKVNHDFLSKLAIEKGFYHSSVNIYRAWKHITFSNGDILFSSCVGGTEYTPKNIYNNFEEFLNIIFDSNPDLTFVENQKELLRMLNVQKKRLF